MPLRSAIFSSVDTHIPDVAASASVPSGAPRAQTAGRSATVRTSFYIDCDKFDTLVKRIFALVMCPFAKSSWKHRTVMQRIPDDDN
eukprot:4338681-Amphidinium_carterae.1